MKFFNYQTSYFIKKNKVSYIILLFLLSLFFQSCQYLDNKNDTYNKGFKTGYIKGLNDCGRIQKITPPKEVTNNTKDPNILPVKKNEVSSEDNPGVPQKAIMILNYIREYNRVPDGYVGGRNFGNYEHNLAERDAAGNAIDYQEWDINKKVEGQNRGTQRLITGSDGRAWYTADHYSTFTEVK